MLLILLFIFLTFHFLFVFLLLIFLVFFIFFTVVGLMLSSDWFKKLKFTETTLRFIDCLHKFDIFSVHFLKRPELFKLLHIHLNLFPFLLEVLESRFNLNYFFHFLFFWRLLHWVRRINILKILITILFNNFNLWFFYLLGRGSLQLSLNFIFFWFFWFFDRKFSFPEWLIPLDERRVGSEEVLGQKRGVFLLGVSV
mgnify:CR=1 FL=1